MEDFWKNEINTDCDIIFYDETEKYSKKLHKIILCANSKYFHRMIINNFRERDMNKFNIYVPNVKMTKLVIKQFYGLNIYNKINSENLLSYLECCEYLSLSNDKYLNIFSKIKILDGWYEYIKPIYNLHSKFKPYLLKIIDKNIEDISRAPDDIKNFVLEITKDDVDIIYLGYISIHNMSLRKYCCVETKKTRLFPIHELNLVVINSERYTSIVSCVDEKIVFSSYNRNMYLQGCYLSNNKDTLFFHFITNRTIHIHKLSLPNLTYEEVVNKPLNDKDKKKIHIFKCDEEKIGVIDFEISDKLYYLIDEYQTKYVFKVFNNEKYIIKLDTKEEYVINDLLNINTKCVKIFKDKVFFYDTENKYLKVYEIETCKLLYENKIEATRFVFYNEIDEYIYFSRDDILICINANTYEIKEIKKIKIIDNKCIVMKNTLYNRIKKIIN